MPSAHERLAPGAAFPDFELIDHAGNRRRLSDLIAGDPAVLQFYRGWWCPKEQAYFRRSSRSRTRSRSPTHGSSRSASIRRR